MHSQLENILDDASRRLDEVRASLISASEGRLDSHIRDQVLANSYVLMEAALESSLKKILSSVIDEINSASIRICDLRWSLFSLLGNPLFNSISNQAKAGSLNKRVELMETLDSTEVCLIDNEYLPLDGRTIRKRHLDLIWRVFGFGGSSLSEARHQFTLETSADARNDVAHGDATASEVAGRQPIETVLRYVDEIEKVILHVSQSADDYLATHGYQR
ncbi:MAE_28990/MAE_18760 family HEPN-like nuclease [Kocuria sp. U4B]